MAYAITFPVIRRRQNALGRFSRLFDRHNCDWAENGSITLGCETITVRFDDYSSEFPITGLTDLRLYFWGYDKDFEDFHGSTGKSIIKMILDKGNNNFIDFEFEGRRYSFEFYIAKKVYVRSLKKILECWYERKHSFTEYFGKLESYLLQHKHILERKKRENEGGG